MSDTPRTDALKVDLSRDTFAVFIEMREHARQLERDLAAANEQVEMVKDIQELLGVKSWHGCYAAIAELKEKLAAKPDVAGLVGAYDEARYHFEDWTGGADTPSKQAELKRRVDAKDAARQRIQDALLSLSAQRDKLQAFKDFVHARLDKAGVPADPPGEHHDAGCRIGQRLDWVFAQLAEKEAELQRTCTAMVEITEAEGLGRADRLQNYLFNQVKLRAEKAEAECEAERNIVTRMWEASGLDSAYSIDDQFGRLRQDAERWRQWSKDFTFYDTEVAGQHYVPSLSSVSKRIWYHACNDTNHNTVQEYVDAAITARKP